VIHQDKATCCLTELSAVYRPYSGKYYAIIMIINTNLDTHYTFQLVTIEILNPIKDSARYFLSNPGCKISLQSSYDREASFLFQ